jgi:hypothetical protein
MAKRRCIVCGYECRDLVRFADNVKRLTPAHHHHTDKQIRNAFDVRNRQLDAHPAVDRVSS